MNRFYRWEDNFYQKAKDLQRVFQNRFADPRRTLGDRFVWDYWHVPGQYTAVRTPAQAYFPEDVFVPFLDHLLNWGRDNLGCESITSAWLSYYVEGCEQRMHADMPHGAWAFVYSLSPQNPKFNGGETFLLSEKTLTHWAQNTQADEHEEAEFLVKIKPRFNRLVVFDPRIPHGVTEVRGVRDPREARLVMHGWFTEPKPFFKGNLSAGKVAPVIDETASVLISQLQQESNFLGIAVLRMQISAAGKLEKFQLLTNTLVDAVGSGPACLSIAQLKKTLGQRMYPKTKGGLEITLPLICR